MKIKLTESFVLKLNAIVDYIAYDKPAVARQFKRDILNRINSLDKMYFRNRKSIYFDNVDIREFIFKGFKIVYKIDEKNQLINVFAIIKSEENID